MFYGETAGTKRKLLNAELNKKKKEIDGYEDEFNKAVENADYAKSAKKTVGTRRRIDTAYRARVSTKQFLGITGSLTVAAAGTLYAANKDRVNDFVAKQGRTAINAIRNFVGK